MTNTLLRFLVVQALLLWQGGFLFYSAFVVPAGGHLIGAEGQGAVTARITDSLNAAGVVGIVILAIELSLTRDTNARRTECRWWAWGVVLVSQFLLLYTHLVLDEFMDEQRKRIIVRAAFYPVHRIYLWTSIVQWVACVLLTWWTLRAWKAEDENSINHKDTKDTKKDTKE